MLKPRVGRQLPVLLIAATAASLGGCSGAVNDLMPQLLAEKPQTPQETQVATTGQTELERATEYWGKQFAANPTDLKAALSYSRNLKAMGQKKQALAALQQAGLYHGQDRELASEYGRLALELGQVQTAKLLLAFADDPTKPDWRVISARGTVFAKEGNFGEAIPMFERALALSNSNPGVLNNLAMAYALSGKPERSEDLLRQAVGKGAPDKARKNLALVLGLQGKYKEATEVGSSVLPVQVAQADTALVRQIVNLEPKDSSGPAIFQPGQAVSPTAVAAAGQAARSPQPSSPASQVSLRTSAPDAPTSGWGSVVSVATAR